MKADAKLILDAIAEEIKKFQGSWKQIACEKDGVADTVDEFGRNLSHFFCGRDAGRTFLAIYSLENDQLIFCAADEGQERPTEFRTRLGQVRRVCRRERP